MKSTIYLPPRFRITAQAGVVSSSEHGGYGAVESTNRNYVTTTYREHEDIEVRTDDGTELHWRTGDTTSLRPGDRVIAYYLSDGEIVGIKSMRDGPLKLDYLVAAGIWLPPTIVYKFIGAVSVLVPLLFLAGLAATHGSGAGMGVTALLALLVGAPVGWLVYGIVGSIWYLVAVILLAPPTMCMLWVVLNLHGWTMEVPSAPTKFDELKRTAFGDVPQGVHASQDPSVTMDDPPSGDEFNTDNREPIVIRISRSREGQQ